MRSAAGFLLAQRRRNIALHPRKCFSRSAMSMDLATCSASMAAAHKKATNKAAD